MAENFHHLGKDKNPHKAQSSKKDECKEPHIETHDNYQSKKEKDRILKAARKTICNVHGNPHKTISRYYSAKTLQAIREGHNIFKVLKEKTAN